VVRALAGPLRKIPWDVAIRPDHLLILCGSPWVDATGSEPVPHLCGTPRGSEIWSRTLTGPLQNALPKSTGPLILPAEVTQGDIPLGLMQTSLRSRLSRMPHGRHIKTKEICIENFSLDGSSHQTRNAAFTPATSQDSQHSRANTDSYNSHNTQHTTRKSKTKHTLLYAKGHLAQPGMFWRTHHTKPDPKSIRVMPLCLWGV
jgi:hypothetical protein